MNNNEEEKKKRQKKTDNENRHINPHQRQITIKRNNS